MRRHVLAREASDELRMGDAPPEPAMVLAGTLRRYKQMADLLAQAEPKEGGGADAASKRRIVLQVRRRLPTH